MVGAPVDFGGRVLPNPDNLQPVLDTDIKPNVEEPSGATMSIENYHAPRITKTPSKDYERIENAPLGHPEMPAIPKHSRVVHYPTGHIVAFSDHLSPAEFDKAAKQAWQKIKEQ
jgi:hypothetical protein